MKDLIQKLKEINDEVDFEHTSGLIDNHILSSLDVIQIVFMLKDEYDVTVPPASIVPANFNSIEAIWNLIQTLKDN